MRLTSVLNGQFVSARGSKGHRLLHQILVVSICILIIFRPSSEVVKEGRISENQTLRRPTGGVFLVGATNNSFEVYNNINEDRWELHQSFIITIPNIVLNPKIHFCNI